MKLTSLNFIPSYEETKSGDIKFLSMCCTRNVLNYYYFVVVIIIIINNSVNKMNTKLDEIKKKNLAFTMCFYQYTMHFLL